LHLLGDLGLHLTKCGGLLHLLEVVLHLVKHLQLVNAVNAALGGGPMGVHKQRQAGKPWGLMARPRARRPAHPGLRVD